MKKQIYIQKLHKEMLMKTDLSGTFYQYFYIYYLGKPATSWRTV